MKKYFALTDPELARVLRAGSVGVLPTDTIYGLAASALQPSAVQRVYDLKGRGAHKPCIILLDSVQRALEFGVPEGELAKVSHLWPAPLSVIFSRIDPQFAYLQRDLGPPPFRVPTDAKLRELLVVSGPLIVPSANREGQPPASTISEAEEVFGETVDFYVDGGQLQGEPSTLVRADVDGSLEILRQGAYHVTKISVP